ncbi:hypothetical protein ACHAXR_003831, partial [Thalassiosira sp. AJA248-18]
MSQEEREAFAYNLALAILGNGGCPSGGYKTCTIRVTEFNNQALRRRLSRRLQNENLLVEYEIILEAICSSDGCNAADVQSVANTLYAEVTGDLKKAINDGTLVSTLQASSSSVGTLLENTVTTGDFSAIVVPILTVLSKFYPDWTGRSGSCKNDGEYPRYMGIMGGYFESSLDACCKRYYSWDYSKCAGDSGSIPSGYYPDWDSNDVKCLESSVQIPAYIRANAATWLTADIEACCERYYSWSYKECVVGSGGTLPAQDGAIQWYVDWSLQKCVMDCEKTSDPQCGGLAKSWDGL